MRIYRIGLFMAWIVVASLAVAGFAAFGTPDDAESTAGESITIAAVSPTLGRSVGAVAGLSFVYLVDGVELTTTTDTDAAVERAILRRVSEGQTTTTTIRPPGQTRDTRGSVFIRSQYLGETDVRRLITSYFEPEDVTRAVRIAWCESSFNPVAVNPVTGKAGLFQHSPETWNELSAQAGFEGASPLEPEANVAVAAWLLYEVPGGWSHWECQA